MDDVQIQGDSPTFDRGPGHEYACRGRRAGADRRGDVRGALLPRAELRAARPVRPRVRRACRARTAPTRRPSGAAFRAPRSMHRSASPLARRSTATDSWAPLPGDVRDQQILAQTHNFVVCSVDTIGFSSGRRREHRGQHPLRPRELPRAHRPGPAGPPQHPLPRAPHVASRWARERRRIPRGRRDDNVGARHRHVAPLLQRQQPGRNPGRRRDRGGARTGRVRRSACRP